MFNQWDTELDYCYEILRKTALTKQEYGGHVLANAVIIGNAFPDKTMVGSLKYVYCATVAEPQLGGVPCKVSQFFLDF